ncbi:MAG: DUF357 domain-containing protein [Thermoplasmata archaeon]
MRRVMSGALEAKLEKDLELTKRALEAVEVIAPERSYVGQIAQDYLGMARAYYEDATHFRKTGRSVEAFAAVNYAHGWLDAGARLGVLDTGGDDQLFTLL